MGSIGLGPRARSSRINPFNVDGPAPNAGARGGLSAYYEAGLRPGEARAWARAGVDPLEAAVRVARGQSPESAGPGKSALGVKELRAWRAAGFKDAAAREWAEAGFTPEQAEEWRRVLRNTAKLKWLREHRAAFLPHQSLIASLGVWREAGIKDPLKLLNELREADNHYNTTRGFEEWARAWNMGANVAQADRVAHLGTADLLEDLLRRGLALELALPLSFNGAARNSIPAARLADWARRYPDLDRRPEGLAYAIIELDLAGLRPDTFEAWRPHMKDLGQKAIAALYLAGYKRPDEARELLELGRKHEFSDLYRADHLQELEQLKITPADLDDYAAAWRSVKGRSDYSRTPVKPLLRFVKGGGEVGERRTRTSSRLPSVRRGCALRAWSSKRPSSLERK